MSSSAKPKNVKCPLDGRLFATKKALAQHRQAVHAGPKPSPGKGPKQPAPNRLTSVNVSSSSATFSGSDLIGSVVMNSKMKVGQQLLVWDVNPNTLVDTRAHQFGQVFSRWRPRKLHVTAVPGAGVFTPGSYAMAWTADASYDIGPLSGRLTRLMALQPNLLSSFGDPRRLVIPLSTTQKWYLTRPGEGVESDHGRVFCVLASTLAADNIGLNFKLDWTFEFDSPEVPPPQEELETYPDPNWLPIFTDSVSNWADGKKLTFKHKSGGAVVPFLNARPGVVYTPADGVSVKYIDSASAEKDVKAIALIQDDPNYQSAMACFETVEKATEYIKSPNISHVLDYKAAGPYVSPDFPMFVAKASSELEEKPLCMLTHAGTSSGKVGVPYQGYPGFRTYFRSALN